MKSYLMLPDTTRVGLNTFESTMTAECVECSSDALGRLAQKSKDFRRAE